MKTAHLLKVLVQTVWVEIDSETGEAVEKVGAPAVVPASSWPEFYAAWKKDWDEIYPILRAAAAPDPVVALHVPEVGEVPAGVVPVSALQGTLRALPDSP